MRASVASLVKITDLNFAVKYELNFQVWLEKNLAQGRLCCSSLVLFLSFVRSQSCIDLPTHTCMSTFTCTGTHLILPKCRTCELSFWATEDWLKTMQGKGRRRRDLQYLLLGAYFRDLTLEMSLRSQRREAGPHVLLLWTAACCDYICI